MVFPCLIEFLVELGNKADEIKANISKQLSVELTTWKICPLFFLLKNQRNLYGCEPHLQMVSLFLSVQKGKQLI